MNKHDDLIAGDEESLRLAVNFGPGSARLRQVGLHALAPMISSASWKLGGFRPLNFGVECPNGGGNIVPVECSVRFSESLRLSGKRRIQSVHFPFPMPL